MLAAETKGTAKAANAAIFFVQGILYEDYSMKRVTDIN